jgi:hypothetical protein
MQFQPVELRGIAVALLWANILLAIFCAGAACAHAVRP